MTQHPTALLDTAFVDIHAGRLDDGFSAVFLGLNGARRLSPPEEWRVALERYIRPHPLHDVALQDPMTRRAFIKPRGSGGPPVPRRGTGASSGAGSAGCVGEPPL